MNGFRRRILIEPTPGGVTAELEDDYHCMVVTLTHEAGIIRRVDSLMKRAPWTLCPGAMEELARTFTGVALDEVAKRGAKAQNCTHLHDLTLFAAARAQEAAPVAYDVHVSDPLEKRRRALLWRDGVATLDWQLNGDDFTGPAGLAGRTMRDLNPWIATLDKAGQEAARILRWACILALGRGMHIPAGLSATAFPSGSCYNFQADRAPGSSRMANADRDFSVPGAAPLADRAAAFLPVHQDGSGI